MPPKRDSKAQHFCGTLWLNIPSEDFCTWTIPLNTDQHYVRYCYQHEISPPGGEDRRRPDGNHIQFFCTTKKPKRYAQLTGLLGLTPGEVHWEAARDAAASWKYCSKDKVEEVRTRCDRCVERQLGEPPPALGRGGGKRQREQYEQQYRQLITAIDAGQSLEQLCRGELGGFVFQRLSNTRTLKSLLQAPRNTPEEWSKRTVYIYYGAAGAGKSRHVREECARFGHRLWVAPIGFKGLWFNGYDNHDAVLIDDFRGDMPLNDMLNLLEGNKVLVPEKGGFVTFAPKLVYFTSDRHWREWAFTGRDGKATLQSPEDTSQLGRRFAGAFELRGQTVLELSPGGHLGGTRSPQASSFVFCEDWEKELDSFFSGGGGNTDTPPPLSTPPGAERLPLSP